MREVPGSNPGRARHFLDHVRICVNIVYENLLLKVKFNFEFSFFFFFFFFFCYLIEISLDDIKIIPNHKNESNFNFKCKFKISYFYCIPYLLSYKTY